MTSTRRRRTVVATIATTASVVFRVPGYQNIDLIFYLILDITLLEQNYNVRMILKHPLMSKTKNLGLMLFQLFRLFSGFLRTLLLMSLISIYATKDWATKSCSEFSVFILISYGSNLDIFSKYDIILVMRWLEQIAPIAAQIAPRLTSAMAWLLRALSILPIFDQVPEAALYWSTCRAG